MNRIIASLALGLTLAACGDPGTDPAPGAADVGPPDAQPGDMAPVDPSALTYHGDLRPLIDRHCVGCHAADRLGPFPLTTYDEARMWAAPMAASVTARRMPPFLADDSGHCQTFQRSSWLTPEQIALFVGWAETGAAEGDPTTPAPPSRELPTLSGPVVRVDTGVDYLPDQARPDDYRCFVVDAPGDLSATGFAVEPGNPRIAHHLIVYQAVDAAAADAARALDAETDTPGYPCLGTGPLIEARSIAGWAPGAGATIFPAGTGVAIRGDLPLIFEMHYNTAGGPGETDRTTLALQTAEGRALTPLHEIGVLDYDFSGPPGEAAWTTSDWLPAQWSVWDIVEDYDGRILIHGINGHMHGRGRAMRIEVSGSVEACLLDIPRWDWNWQQSYWFEAPVEINAADLLSITCVFDTRGLDGPLVWGDGTGDEMCLGGLYATLLD